MNGSDKAPTAAHVAVDLLLAEAAASTRERFLAAIVNPPANKRATFRSAGDCAPADSQEWMRESVAHEGSWWLDWNAWLAERDEATRRAPRRLGSRRYPILGDAPGEYVHER
jgi:poly[(R)-3-hydroxyalkanoate] polymerase subunit PhaC